MGKLAFSVIERDDPAWKSGYRYRLEEDFAVAVPEVAAAGESGFCSLVGGEIKIKAGYAWDGPSGPAVDTMTFARGSLVHDALYQLIREGKLPIECRADADEVLYRLCREDGMGWWRAHWVYSAVRWFAGPAVLTD